MKTLLAALLLTAPVSGEVLQLTNTAGKSISAELLNIDAEHQITLKRADGKTFTISADLLSNESQKIISDSWIAVRSEMVDPINEAIGHPLFGPTGDLFGEPVADVAKRLAWPQESKTPYTSSFRSYASSKYTFFGARPYSCVAYGGSDENTLQLSLVFANKGDSLSNVGSGEDHFNSSGEPVDVSSLSGAMDYDEDLILTKLTALFGEPERQRFGEGNSRRTVTRWDWNSHAFLLTALSGEYVGLQIVPPEFADNGGATDRISDGDLRKRLENDVTTEANGDVYIQNIPMVDQGPKGYCAPATFERAMRHVGVPADMYLLATVATTEGGGTDTATLFSEVRSSISRKGRRPRDLSAKDLEMKKVKRYIDKGIPLMWQMSSTTAYNSIANDRTVARQGVSDWSAWTAKITAEAEENVSSLRPVGSYHICMIIGYNETTGELAVSDSWGEDYTIRWVHHTEAAAVSNESGFAIDL